MNYMTFILTVENLINTVNVSPENGGIKKALETVNSMIDNGVHNKTIFECNIPKLRITYDRLAGAYYCHPANVHTMYMSLTMGYFLNNTEQYERFTYLTSHEPQFVKDLEKKYKSAIIKADLRALKEFPGLTYYINVFGFPKYNDRHFLDILDTLLYEFKVQTRGRQRFSEFQSAVYSLIERVDTLFGMSGGAFDANKAWQYIFDKNIRNIGISLYYARCDNDKFRSLYTMYDDNNIENRKNSKYTYTKKKKEQAPPPPVIKPQKSERDEFISFMGLFVSYNGKQLKKRFRKLAIRYHPDKSGGDSEKFLYLKKCYEALKQDL